ncbi:MAG: hypothetical protein LBK41_06470 [Clostridiales bacterium]|jgi:hypothetical protein|nr:hypothetical protein [Clostridiales bacterium]
MSDYSIYKYIRLSMDDAKTDSVSIENQRLLLNRIPSPVNSPKPGGIC